LLAGSAAWSLGLCLPRKVQAATPTQRKAAVLARALSYERTLAERAGSTVDIMMVHAGGAGLDEAQGWTSAFGSLSAVKVAGKKLATHTAVIGPEMTGALASGEIDVIITCGDIAAVLVEEVGSVTARNKVLSVGTRRSQVEQALTFGVVEEGGKLQMLVNLRAAKREGVRFSSKLLKLAEVIR
jgi:hypothetical protein